MAGMDNAAFARLMAIIKSPEYVEVAVGNRTAIIDFDDLPLVQGHRWYINKGGYAFASIGGRNVTMHRLIMGVDPSKMMDHKDGNRLNNRRANLRFCTAQENARNRHVVAGRSRFKGVRRDRGMWRAAIRRDGKIIDLGFFTTERLAARAYDKAAKQVFGAFAKTNEQLGLF